MEFILGRECEGPIAIPKDASTVSSSHATIKIEGEDWILEDNNSTNGTYIEKNGEFVRVSRMHIKPDTWVRLGTEGHKGVTFKARRVVCPTDYSQDFKELREEYNQLTHLKEELESRQSWIAYIMPALSLSAFGLSYLITDSNLARLIIMLPSFLTGPITKLLLGATKRKALDKGKLLICPKCRRQLQEYDILNGQCTMCKAM